MNRKKSTIGVIAAGGKLPLDVAHALRGRGDDVLVVLLEGISTEDFSGFSSLSFHIGALGKIIGSLTEAGCRQVVMAGKLERPLISSIKPDLRGMKIFIQLMISGDDTALRILKGEFQKDGIEILDIGDVISDLYADSGVMSGGALAGTGESALEVGIGFLEAIGDFDMGQGCVVQGLRVLAVEGAEGTDEMLMRSRGLIDRGGADAVFVKMPKLGQDPSLDPPVVGVETTRHAAASGIKVIALQAGRVMMVDKAEMISAAEGLGLTLLGFEREV